MHISSSRIWSLITVSIFYTHTNHIYIYIYIYIYILSLTSLSSSSSSSSSCDFSSSSLTLSLSLATHPNLPLLLEGLLYCIKHPHSVAQCLKKYSVLIWQSMSETSNIQFIYHDMWDGNFVLLGYVHSNSKIKFRIDSCLF